MTTVGDIILTDNRKRQAEQLAQALQIWNMIRAQKAEEMKAREEERRNRLEELRYKEFERKNRNDERMAEQVLRNEKEREAKTIGFQQIKPLMDKHDKIWNAHRKVLASANHIVSNLKSAKDSKTPAYYDSQAIAAMDRLAEALGDAARVSAVHEGELKARIGTVSTFYNDAMNKYALNAKDKKYLTPEQREEFINKIYDKVENDHYGYKNNYDDYEKKVDYFKGFIKPEYAQYLPQSGIFHDADPTYKEFDDVYKMREEARKSAYLRSIGSPVIQGDKSVNNYQNPLAQESMKKKILGQLGGTDYEGQTDEDPFTYYK